MPSAIYSKISVPAEPSSRARGGSEAAALWVSLRPQQWTKNLLVLAGVVFSGSAMAPAKLAAAGGATALFCLASSAAYLLNDLRDRREDRRHTGKRLRPLAAGTLRPAVAKVACGALALAAAAGSLLLPPLFGMTLAAYLLLNVGYSLGLKHVAILDALLIAACFVLRAAAGAFAVGVVPSPWLTLCSMMLALLVALGKRRHELLLLEGAAGRHRASLDGYTGPLLDQLMTVAASAAVVTYSLYTLADETVQRFGTRAMLFTVPCVVYGIFRYLWLVHLRRDTGDPARLFATDIPTLLNLALWGALACGIVYGGLSLPNWR